MVNIENEIYTLVKNAILSAFPEVEISGVYMPVVSKFPAIQFVEQNNNVYAQGRDSARVENFARVMYEVNVYSNNQTSKKTECKKIMNIIDEVMASYGFERTMLNPMPNLNDATIFRLTARYQAVVSRDKTIYRS